MLALSSVPVLAEVAAIPQPEMRAVGYANLGKGVSVKDRDEV
jgi:hypothetical protein